MSVRGAAIIQLAYIVKPGELKPALDYWVDVMGAGPFFVGEFPLENQVFRGNPTNMTAQVAVGYHGDVQVELINPTNDAPGPYKEWLETHPKIPVGGIYHHVMVGEGNFDATYARLIAAGCKDAFTGIAPDGGRIVYLDASETTGGYIEIISSQLWPAICAEMREITRNWDGSSPTRGFDTLKVRII